MRLVVIGGAVLLMLTAAIHPGTAWPPIPPTVNAPGGMVTVRYGGNLRGDDSVEAWGVWNPESRTITLDSTIRFPAFRWRIFYHELAHVAIHDSGLINLLEPDAEEALADAIATARVREMRR